MYDEPYGDLDSLIQGAIEEFRCDRQNAWRSAVDGGEAVVADMDGAATMVLRACKQLLEPTPTEDWEFTWSETRYFLNHPTFSKLIKESLQIEVAQRFSGDTASQAQRCLDLVHTLMDIQGDVKALQFIARIAPCYVAGLDSECFVLCRAIVEGAVNATFARLGEKPPWKFASKIDRAKERQWLSTDIADIANHIWDRGSDFAHPLGKRSNNADALSFIRRSVTVVNALNAAE